MPSALTRLPSLPSSPFSLANGGEGKAEFLLDPLVCQPSIIFAAANDTSVM